MAKHAVGALLTLSGMHWSEEVAFLLVIRKERQPAAVPAAAEINAVVIAFIVNSYCGVLSHLLSENMVIQRG